MKFAEIIINSGIDLCKFKKVGNIDITLYDAKDRISCEENVHYVEPLFKHNEGSLKNFENFLTGLERETVDSMNVKVDISSVVLFYKTPRAIVFSRRISMHPLDYME